jgi:TPR repeat protein
MAACENLLGGRQSDIDATRAAAEAGDMASQHRMGVYYDDGVGGVADPAEAVRWYRLAARQGSAESQYALARHYRTGRGVVLDPAWGARWLGKAAAQGLAPAQAELGLVYSAGEGLPQSDVWALRWMALGLRNGADVSAIEQDEGNPELIEAASSYTDAWVEAFEAGSGPWFLDAPTVRYVQTALSQLDYSAGAVDGTLGPQTRAAIRDYRMDAGLATSDTIDADLIRRLRLDFGDA